MLHITHIETGWFFGWFFASANSDDIIVSQLRRFLRKQGR
jgi:hypothetical protein